MQLIKNVIDSTKQKIEQLKPTKYEVRTYEYRPSKRPWRRGDATDTITVWGDRHNPTAELMLKQVTPLCARLNSRLRIRPKGQPGEAGTFIDSLLKVRYNSDQLKQKAA